ncbi:MAG: MFS transporter [Bryobacteraceae bacterium]
MGFLDLLRRNRNCRRIWLGQVVSEAGDYFNNVAVLSLVMQATGSGMVVSGVMLARAIPAVLAGPLAGVMLDRFDRRRIMLASDLVRVALALAFVITVRHPEAWLLYLLSALLMFASPFFTAGRAAILPSIAAPHELHTANSLTQTTQWATLAAGAMLAGWSVAKFGYEWAFLINSASFLFSAACVWRLELPGGFRAVRTGVARVVRPWREYREGLRYMASQPLTLGIAMITVGWALGGGAAQVLFALFGEQVFGRGAAGIGEIWGFAGAGLLLGGWLGHAAGNRAGFTGYKRTVSVCYVMHGVAYVAFSQMTVYWAALLLMLLSRVGMAVSSVLNNSQLLRHTPDEYRGRVFSTMETLRWAVMMLSMAAAGIASGYVNTRTLGAVAGVLGTLTAVYWTWADATGRLPEPRPLKNLKA